MSSRFCWSPGDLDFEPEEEGGTAVLTALVHKFNDLRDAIGRYAGPGGGTRVKSFKLRTVNVRADRGYPRVTRTQFSRGEVGKLAERIAISHYRDLGFKNADTLNVARNNFPVDMIHDHQLTEVKGGLVSNGLGSRDWRCKIGQPSATEQAWLDKASPTAKALHNATKMKGIIARKYSIVSRMSKAIGRPVGGNTLTMIIDPDRQLADIYYFKGFHRHIAWNSPQAAAGYLRTVRYSE
jgi:hypothetical protein